MGLLIHTACTVTAYACYFQVRHWPSGLYIYILCTIPVAINMHKLYDIQVCVLVRLASAVSICFGTLAVQKNAFHRTRVIAGEYHVLGVVNTRVTVTVAQSTCTVTGLHCLIRAFTEMNTCIHASVVVVLNCRGLAALACYLLSKFGTKYHAPYIQRWQRTSFHHDLP